jgi:hypothetical protein
MKLYFRYWDWILHVMNRSKIPLKDITIEEFMNSKEIVDHILVTGFGKFSIS